MPSDEVAQPDDQPRNETVFVRSKDGEKTLVKSLAEGLHNCSEAAFIRHLVKEHAYDELDEDTADLILSGDISEEDAVALVENETTVAELTEDEPASAVADGGNATCPGNYTASLTPNELGTSGPELSWNELRDLVADPEDGGLWSNGPDLGLTIHPDRVPEDVLKPRHKPATRILVGMIRNKAMMYGDLIPGDELDEIIETYCYHLTDRFDEERGKEHIHETYRENVEQFLYEDPHPSKDKYFTTEERYHESVEVTIQNDVNPALVNEVPGIFTQTTWNEASEEEIDTEDWHGDLGEHVELAAAAQQIADDIEYEDLETMEFEQVDDAKDAAHHFTLLWIQFRDAYTDVPRKTQEKVERHFVTDEALDRLNL